MLWISLFTNSWAESNLFFDMRYVSAIKTLAVILTILSFAFYISGYKADARTPGISEHFAAADSGADIYNRSCASCHGEDGRAQTRRGKRKGAKDLTKSKISTAMGLKVITHGRGSMPAFKDTLSRERIRTVNSFVRGLRE